jgi:tetratricopeptide (TPR) repeat protein
MRNSNVTSGHMHNAAGLENKSNRNFAGAIAEFTRAIFIDPQEPTYYWNRAETFLSLCQFESSLQDYFQFQKLIARNVKNPSKGYVVTRRLAKVLFTVGQCFLDQHRYTEAEKMFMDALNLGVNRDSVLLRLYRFL